jgi:LCP family protein required for cell wall assembly
MSRRSRNASRVGSALAIVVVLSIAAGASGWWWLRGRLDSVSRPNLSGELASPSSSAWNILVVGSDSRLGVDRTDRDQAAMGDEGDVTGQRSDTILVLRIGDGPPRMLSLPRDLWVPIEGGPRNRLNAAFGRGPSALVRTISSELGLPIHHYLEIDFQGFKDLVDALGGVKVWFPYQATDPNTGLNVPQGCNRLDGVSALAYARSRKYEYFDGFVWRTDGTSDLGRIQRQQDLLRRVALTAFREVRNPLNAADLLDATTGVITTDLTPAELSQAGAKLRSFGNGIEQFTYPASGDNVDGKSVLRPDADAAAAIIALFNGEQVTLPSLPPPQLAPGAPIPAAPAATPIGPAPLLPPDPCPA